MKWVNIISLSWSTNNSWDKQKTYRDIGMINIIIITRYRGAPVAPPSRPVLDPARPPLPVPAPSHSCTKRDDCHQRDNDDWQKRGCRLILAESVSQSVSLSVSPRSPWLLYKSVCDISPA